MKEKIKIGTRILIRGPDTVGSFVLATPFFRELRKNLQNQYIALCVKNLVYELAKDCPYVDKIILYQKNVLENIKNFKKEKFDTVFLLSGSFESAFVSFLAGIKNRVGYPHDNRSIFLTHKVLERQRKHYIDYILYILEDLGYKIEDRRPEIFIKQENKKYDFLFKDKKVIGITYTSAGNDARKWPKEFVLKLKDMLKERGFKVVLLGKDKENTFSQIDNEEDFVNLINKTTLSEFINIVKKLYAYVSVATGGIHIASLLGVKVIGLYIKGDEVGWSPYGENVKVLTKDLKCTPCNPHKMKYCKNNICMKLITPQEVIELIT